MQLGVEIGGGPKHPAIGLLNENNTADPDQPRSPILS
jgi:hypothetical protein